MANVFRHRYGDAKPKLFAVDSAQVIEIGDLVYEEVDDVRQADQITFGVTASVSKIADAQLEFAAKFAGVALDASPVGTASTIRVAQGGVHEFACASATFEQDDMVGPDDNAGATALVNQNVIAVTDEIRAIGKVAVRVAVAATIVMVEIMPQLAKDALKNRSTFGGTEVDSHPVASAQFDLVPAGVLPAGAFLIACFGVVTEGYAGTTEDQGIMTIYDGDNNALATLTPSDAGADAVGDLVLGSVSYPATGTAIAPIAAGKKIYAKLTQQTANGDAAGKMKVYIEIVR